MAQVTIAGVVYTVPDTPLSPGPIHWVLYNAEMQNGLLMAKLFMSVAPVNFEEYRGIYLIQGQTEVPHIPEGKTSARVMIRIHGFSLDQIAGMRDAYSAQYPMSCPTAAQVMAMFGVDVSGIVSAIDQNVSVFCSETEFESLRRLLGEDYNRAGRWLIPIDGDVYAVVEIKEKPDTVPANRGFVVSTAHEDYQKMIMDKVRYLQIRPQEIIETDERPRIEHGVTLRDG